MARLNNEPMSLPDASHRYRRHLLGIRWLAILLHIGQWVGIWYVLSVCLAFYPFDLVWQMASGAVGFAIWVLITLGSAMLLARDLWRDLRKHA